LRVRAGLLLSLVLAAEELLRCLLVAPFHVADARYVLVVLIPVPGKAWPCLEKPGRAWKKPGTGTSGWAAHGCARRSRWGWSGLLGPPRPPDPAPGSNCCACNHNRRPAPS